MNTLTRSGRRLVAAGTAVLSLAAVTGVAVTGVAATATAASADGCAGGGFSLVNLTSGVTVAAGGTTPVARSIRVDELGPGDRFGVRGRYVSFDVRPSSFAVLEWTFTGAANPLDITGGVRTPVFESKVPDHRGLTLTSALTADLAGADLVIRRTGPGLSMKLQAKDCAQGGIFQMEPARGDLTKTRVVHTLAAGSATSPAPFYFDNPLFRERVGQFLGSGCTSDAGPAGQFCVQVTPRVNIAGGRSADFVARDSAQVATRVPQPCNTAVPVTPSVRHCGRQSVWDVASGGRLGFVTGEDAVEVANPPTTCVQDCQAQNQVKGRLAVLGFPFPVPAGSRLTPPTAPITP